MKFTVTDLKILTKMLRSANPEEEIQLSRRLKSKQPGFCAMIDDVTIDPRCTDSFRFCSLFCSLALERAELVSGYDFQPFSESQLVEIAGKIVRGNEQIGKRACTYPDRIQKHVLSGGYFDDEDSAWLRMMISAFLFTLEKHS